MSKIIEKKVYIEYYQKIFDGLKTYELRLADWDCQEGDLLKLVEIDSDRQPTGREMTKKVGYVGKTKDLDFWTSEEIEKYGYQIISLLDIGAKH